MEWKIVVDTACDFREIPNKAENVTYERVPFSLQIEDKVYVDTLDLDIDEMMREMYASSEAARSACPSPEAYLSAYRGAENVIVLYFVLHLRLLFPMQCNPLLPYLCLYLLFYKLFLHLEQLIWQDFLRLLVCQSSHHCHFLNMKVYKQHLRLGYHKQL